MTLPIEILPTPKSERWKYTNLPRALKGKNLAAATLGWGVSATPIKNAAPGAALYGDTVLWDLNMSDSKDILHVAGDREVEITGVQGQYLSPRIIIHVPDGETFTVTERHAGQDAYWKNLVVQISVGRNACLHHHRFLNEAKDGVNTIFTHITLAEGARYEGFGLTAGDGFIRNQFHAEIQGPNAHCGFAGISLLQGDQHGDTTITIEHQAPHCTSNQTFKTVLDGRAHGVFQGKVHVHRPAQKTDGYQLSNALILSPTAEMDTKPELEIYADDVKCSHGATTGRLDDAPLFYMRARGIPEAAARALLIEAFCNQAVETIADESVQDAVRAEVSRWLSSRA